MQCLRNKTVVLCGLRFLRSSTLYGFLSKAQTTRSYRRAVATFEAAASVVFRTVASVKAILLRPFLANVSEFTFTICYRPSVCLSSVTFMRPTQAVQIFGNISMALDTLAIHRRPLKISRRSSQGNPSAGGVKHKRGSQV